MTSLSTRARVLGADNNGDVQKSVRPPRRAVTEYEATMEERFVFASMNLVGKTVTVQTLSGKEYDGILHTCSQDGKKLAIVLSLVRERLALDALAVRPVKLMTFSAEDIVQVIARETDLFYDEVTEAARKNTGEVLADTEIDSSHRGGAGQMRELQAATAWVGGEDDGGLEAVPHTSKKSAWDQKGAWDQFAVNEKLTGSRSSYHDDLYTTSLSGKKFTAEQLAAAERLAREIELKPTTNIHVAEERGQRALAENDDMDEEDKYSTVLRTEEKPTPSKSSGKGSKSGDSSAAAKPPSANSKAQQPASASVPPSASDAASATSKPQPKDAAAPSSAPARSAGGRGAPAAAGQPAPRPAASGPAPAGQRNSSSARAPSAARSSPPEPPAPAVRAPAAAPAAAGARAPAAAPAPPPPAAPSAAPPAAPSAAPPAAPSAAPSAAPAAAAAPAPAVTTSKLRATAKEFVPGQGRSFMPPPPAAAAVPHSPGAPPACGCGPSMTHGQVYGAGPQGMGGPMPMQGVMPGMHPGQHGAQQGQPGQQPMMMSGQASHRPSFVMMPPPRPGMVLMPVQPQATMQAGMMPMQGGSVVPMQPGGVYAGLAPRMPPQQMMNAARVMAPARMAAPMGAAGYMAQIPMRPGSYAPMPHGYPQMSARKGSDGQQT